MSDEIWPQRYKDAVDLVRAAPLVAEGQRMGELFEQQVGDLQAMPAPMDGSLDSSPRILARQERASCDCVEAACVCKLPANHAGAHECDCGGSWTFDEDGSFLAVKLPGVFGSVPLVDGFIDPATRETTGDE